MAKKEGIRVQIKGDKEVRDLIREYQNKLGDLSTPFADFGEYKLRALRQQWDRQEDPWGQKWKPLARETIEEKRRNNKHLEILVRDNILRTTFAYKEKPDSLSIGTNRRYAPAHQLGRGVPKREFLGVNEADIKELLDTFVDYLPT